LSIAAFDSTHGSRGAGRLFLCARCHVLVVICRRCDRGQIYCAAGCAREARREAQRAAGRRYQASDRGRATHALRSRRYRARRNAVTHHGSPPASATASTAAGHSVGGGSTPSRSAPDCHVCGGRCSPFVRLGFLRRRRAFSNNFPMLQTPSSVERPPSPPLSAVTTWGLYATAMVPACSPFAPSMRRFSQPLNISRNELADNGLRLENL
jgi:hypothetical protein